MSEPLFSVVIPTRNRANLLPSALQSALEQTFEDFEVIVSNNNSRDDTKAVVESFDDRKLRYVETGRTLAMPDHWEFALDHARGQYVTYLCDDDAWCPAVLQRVAAVIASDRPKITVVGTGLYYGPNWFHDTRRNLLVIEPHSSRTLKCDSHETLKKIFKCGNLYDAPRMLNSFCHRESLMRIRAETKRIFLLAPDYSFPALTLTRIPTWVFIDEPLRLQGIFPEGIGSAQAHNRGEPAEQFLREFGDPDIFKKMPVKAPVSTNYIGQTLATVKELQPTALAEFDIDWEQYFARCWFDIAEHERNGVNVEADKQQFFDALSLQEPNLQAAVRALITAPAPPVDTRSALRKSVRNIINSSSVLTGLESFIRRPRTERTETNDGNGAGPNSSLRFIHGEYGGFRDILECARRLEELERNGVNAEPARTT